MTRNQEEESNMQSSLASPKSSSKNLVRSYKYSRKRSSRLVVFPSSSFPPSRHSTPSITTTNATATTRRQTLFGTSSTKKKRFQRSYSARGELFRNEKDTTNTIKLEGYCAWRQRDFDGFDFMDAGRDYYQQVSSDDHDHPEMDGAHGTIDTCCCPDVSDVSDEPQSHSSTCTTILVPSSTNSASPTSRVVPSSSNSSTIISMGQGFDPFKANGVHSQQEQVTRIMMSQAQQDRSSPSVAFLLCLTGFFVAVFFRHHLTQNAKAVRAALLVVRRVDTTIHDAATTAPPAGADNETKKKEQRSKREIKRTTTTTTAATTITITNSSNNIRQDHADDGSPPDFTRTTPRVDPPAAAGVPPKSQPIPYYTPQQEQELLTLHDIIDDSSSSPPPKRPNPISTNGTITTTATGPLLPAAMVVPAEEKEEEENPKPIRTMDKHVGRRRRRETRPRGWRVPPPKTRSLVQAVASRILKHHGAVVPTEEEEEEDGTTTDVTSTPILLIAGEEKQVATDKRPNHHAKEQGREIKPNDSMVFIPADCCFSTNKESPPSRRKKTWSSRIPSLVGSIKKLKSSPMSESSSSSSSVSVTLSSSSLPRRSRRLLMDLSHSLISIRRNEASAPSGGAAKKKSLSLPSTEFLATSQAFEHDDERLHDDDHDHDEDHDEDHDDAPGLLFQMASSKNSSKQTPWFVIAAAPKGRPNEDYTADDKEEHRGMQMVFFDTVNQTQDEKVIC
jgi:hypothetical protein